MLLVAFRTVSRTRDAGLHLLPANRPRSEAVSICSEWFAPRASSDASGREWMQDNIRDMGPATAADLSALNHWCLPFRKEVPGIPRPLSAVRAYMPDGNQAKACIRWREEKFIMTVHQQAVVHEPIVAETAASLSSLIK